jgi:hypothetical protein
MKSRCIPLRLHITNMRFSHAEASPKLHHARHHHANGAEHAELDTSQAHTLALCSLLHSFDYCQLCDMTGLSVSDRTAFLFQSPLLLARP